MFYVGDVLYVCMDYTGNDTDFTILLNRGKFTGVCRQFLFGNSRFIWYKDGLTHRDSTEGPAIIYQDGYKEYWDNGSRLPNYQI